MLPYREGIGLMQLSASSVDDPIRILNGDKVVVQMFDDTFCRRAWLRNVLCARQFKPSYTKFWNTTCALGLVRWLN